MERDRDPIRGPVTDVANFLAQIFEEGYQYRSLNAYRSAIGSVHEKIDGVEVGKHPLIARILKGFSIKDLLGLSIIQCGMLTRF